MTRPQTPQLMADKPLAKQRWGVLIDMRYSRDESGRYWTDDPMIKFVQGLLSHVAEVVLVGRVAQTGRAAQHIYRADIEGASVVALPDYPRIANLATQPLRYWPKIESVLEATLPTLDRVWLNFGHPVSLRALHRCVSAARPEPFAVLRGHYDVDAAARSSGSQFKQRLVGAVATNLMASFANTCRNTNVRCVGFGTGPRLTAYGLANLAMMSSLLPADALHTPENPSIPESDLLVVGRLGREKGVDVLLDALALVDGATLRVVGDGEERSALQAQAASLGVADRVWFDGMLPFGTALFQRYLATRLVVIPSRTEGAPKAAYEAMAFGKPVVGTAVGALPEIIGSGGERGAVVAPNDSKMLANAISTALTTPGWIASRRIPALEMGQGLTLDGQVATLVRFVADTD